MSGLMKTAAGHARIEEDEQWRVKGARGPAEPEGRAWARPTRPPEGTAGPVTPHACVQERVRLPCRYDRRVLRGSRTDSGIRARSSASEFDAGGRATPRLKPEHTATQVKRRLDRCALLWGSGGGGRAGKPHCAAGPARNQQ